MIEYILDSFEKYVEKKVEILLKVVFLNVYLIFELYKIKGLVYFFILILIQKLSKVF